MKYQKGDIVKWVAYDGQFVVKGTKEDPYKGTASPWGEIKTNIGADYIIVRTDAAEDINKPDFNAFHHVPESQLELIDRPKK